MRYLSTFNIESDARLVRRQAERISRRAFSLRAAMDREGKQDETLVLIQGETHRLPACTALHVGLCEELSRRESIAVTHESPHAASFIYARHLMNGARLTEEQSSALHHEDRHGKMSLHAHIGFRSVMVSPYSGDALFRYLLRNDIPFRPVDAVQKIGEELDLDDKETFQSLNVLFTDPRRFPPKGVNRGTVHGRNFTMARLTHEFSCAVHPRINILVCGGAHACGDPPYGMPPAESIACIFRDRGYTTFSVPNMARSRVTQKDTGITGNEMHTECTFPSVPTARYDVDDAQAMPGCGNRIDNIYDEAYYFNSLVRHCGWGRAAMNPGERVKAIRDSRAAFKNTLSAILR